MPTWLAASVFAVLALAGAGFWAHRLVVGGRWGQRTHAQRVLAVGGVAVFGGLTTGAAGILVDQPGVVLAAGFVLTAGLLAVMVGEPLARRVDHRRSARIRRDIGLH